MASPIRKSFAPGSKSNTQSTGYPKNWNDISAAYREEHKYTCKICGVNCSEYPKLTDAHHKNGVKSDCKYENLECLCKYHHGKQEFHAHYKTKEEDLEILRKLWEEQNIPHDKRG